jgi:hypothetical protein
VPPARTTRWRGSVVWGRVGGVVSDWGGTAHAGALAEALGGARGGLGVGRIGLGVPAWGERERTTA